VTADATPKKSAASPAPVVPDLTTTAGRIADLKVRYHEAVTASGEAAIEKQHKKGKKTARERIEQLRDRARPDPARVDIGLLKRNTL
jgi:propionyl-CoA carboxylase beta chain